MKTPPFIALLGIVVCSLTTFKASSQTQVKAGPGGEQFRQTILVSNTSLDAPWEVTYGPDDSLWITESKGYKVWKMSPNNPGTMRNILNINKGEAAVAASGTAGTAAYNSARLASYATASWCKQYTVNGASGDASNGIPDPQGGLMGLAIHPEFMTNPYKKFVYLAYVYSWTGFVNNSKSQQKGAVFVTRLTRWTFDTVSGRLINPSFLCDTIPGSGDHNSGRMIIAPVAGKDYLFYAVGDMGAGQFDNKNRENKAQTDSAYEGKILRFNLEWDGDSVGGRPALDRWIPDDNPLNRLTGGSKKQNAVWSKGMRNNQGLAKATINGVDMLYGSSHGPYSDDEINIIGKNLNFGHPFVVGDTADNNYYHASIGTPGSSAPYLAGTEKHIADSLGPNYRDPMFSAYKALMGASGVSGTVQDMYLNQTDYLATPWPCEAWTGMDMYTNSIIPGFKNSLITASLKWGRLLHLATNSTGTKIVKQGTVDTVPLFQSKNRYRDLAFNPDGKTMYVAMERNSTSSGPSAGNTTVPACAGCIVKYAFLGYAKSGNNSDIPSYIPVAAGTPGFCENANTVTINAANNNTGLWVPITDQNSNIIAEIFANGNNLGTVTTSFYTRTGVVREDSAKRLYANRNITISVQTQPIAASPVSIRLYITDAELNSLKTATNSSGTGSGVTGIGNVAIFKNSTSSCADRITMAAAKVTASTFTGAQGSAGWYLGGNITSFSTFYFASSALATLPLNLLDFTGALDNTVAHLKWKTAQEQNVSKFFIERSSNGTDFTDIGTVKAAGNATNNYTFDDAEATSQPGTLVYYRLRVVDNDGSTNYSKIVVLNIPYIAGRVTVAPNPVKNETHVTIVAKAAGKAEWQVTDNTGRIILQSNTSLQMGNNSFNVNLSKFAAGIYYLNVNGTGIDKRVKIQKL